MINLLVMAPCDTFQKEMLDKITNENYNVTFADKDTDSNKLQGLINESEVIIGEPSIEQISEAKNLRWIQMTWAGTDIYTRKDGFPEHVRVSTASGAFGKIISEYVLGAILMQYRNFPGYLKNQEQALWQDAGTERTLENKTALILGTGDIGINIAKRLRAFETKTVGIRRNRNYSAPYFDEVHTLEQLDQLLPQADIVIGCLPNTKETIGLLNEKRLHIMKDDALFINVGRGSLVDMDALVRVLQQGHLFGAVLDVVNQEPLPKESPLWTMKNVMITPHISGISFGHEKATENKIWKICCENLNRYKRGERLKNQVDFTTGYRRKEE